MNNIDDGDGYFSFEELIRIARPEFSSENMTKLFSFLLLVTAVSGFLNPIVKQLQYQRCNSKSFTKPLSMVATQITLETLPDAEELDQILKIAMVAARKAGVLIRDNIGARVKYSKTNYKVKHIQRHAPFEPSRKLYTLNLRSKICFQFALSSLDVVITICHVAACSISFFVAMTNN